MYRFASRNRPAYSRQLAGPHCRTKGASPSEERDDEDRRTDEMRRDVDDGTSQKVAMLKYRGPSGPALPTIDIDGRGSTIQEAIADMWNRVHPLLDKGYHPTTNVE